MKVLLLDADGVLLKSDELFSNRFSHEYNVPMESVTEFFRGPFSDCQAGKKDMKEELPAYLEKWGWKSGMDEFLRYWFATDTVFNSAVCDAIETMQAQGFKCYLASNNERYRATDLWQHITERMSLDGHFFSWEMQEKKDNPAFFEKVMECLNVTSSEVYFIDDDQKNVDAANSIGIKGYLYNDGVFNEILATI